MRFPANGMRKPVTLAKPIGLLLDDAVDEQMTIRLAGGGRRVLVHTLRGAKRRAPAKAIEYVATPADIAMECDCVLSMIEDTTRLRQVLLGSQDRLGLGLEIAPGATLIDFGIRPPRECQALMGTLGMRGLSLIDAAIVGTPQALANGTATVLTGGFPDAVDAALPVLELIGRVERTGPLGSAHTAAALMGYMEAAHTIALEEASRVGQALGLNSDVLGRFFEAEPAPGNIITFSRRADLAGRLVHERGLSAEVIDLTLRKLRQGPSENG